MSETPRTDTFVAQWFVAESDITEDVCQLLSHACQLERDLSCLRDERDKALAAAKEAELAAPVLYGPEKQQYPGGPIYREGVSSGAAAPSTESAAQTNRPRPEQSVHGGTGADTGSAAAPPAGDGLPEAWQLFLENVKVQEGLSSTKMNFLGDAERYKAPFEAALLAVARGMKERAEHADFGWDKANEQREQWMERALKAERKLAEAERELLIYRRPKSSTRSGGEVG